MSTRLNEQASQLARTRGGHYSGTVTAEKIIEEIKRLPRAEQDRVIEFVRHVEKSRSLSPEQLGQLARRMVEAEDSAEADRLKEEIVRGFYGEKPHA